MRGGSEVALSDGVEIRFSKPNQGNAFVLLFETDAMVSSTE